ncbi:hypothetical protein C7476_105311 [Phyllobacterium bourgognense]|uniref:Uncharacterized protein n=1 Tax=Phyllobacterium bourgognense TaxID=314236 RepID=A0A368YUC7_9HYPH|nr:hypothetical protein C7476_105311 [Phyllobacterium bourgognense]
MRVPFDDDPNDERDTPPSSHYGLIFCMGIALAIVGSWLIHLERSDPMFW